MSRITFEYGAILNLNKGHGYVPQVLEDGRETMNTWSSYGMSEEEAKFAATGAAIQKASRFVGDWDIVIRPIGESLV